MLKHGRIFTVLLLANYLLISACLAGQPQYQHGISLLHKLKYPTNFRHFDYVNPTAPKGGSLTLIATGSIRNFSGAWGTSVVSASGIERTADRLFLRAADEQSAMYGLLADGVALSANRKSLFIRLHDKARWHDGVPVTTRDIRFSWEKMDRISLGGFSYMRSWVESIEFVNDREWVIHHRDVFTDSHVMSLTTFQVRPAHYYGDDDPGEPTLVPPIGSGPYRIAEFDQDFVVYERVKDYWGRYIPVNTGRHNFDRIRFDVYRDTTVAREAFRKGLFDVFVESDVRYWSSSYDIPALHDGRLQKDTREVKNNIGQELALTFNLERVVFRDVRVREALTMAFDFEWQNRVFHHGSQRRALSYFAGSELAATGLPTAEEISVLEPYRDQLPPRVFTEPFQLPVSTGWGENRVALERARDLLVEAGWKFVDGRLLDADGQPFRIEIATQTPSARRMLLPYIETLSILGIDARLRLLDVVMAMRYKKEREFDIYLRAHEFGSPPMGGLRGYFGSQNAVAGTGGNLAGIRDPIVDELIELAQVPDMVTATNVCRALDRVLLWGFYHIPLNMYGEERFLYWNQFGRPDESAAVYSYLTEGFMRVIDSWWFDENNNPD